MHLVNHVEADPYSKPQPCDPSKCCVKHCSLIFLLSVFKSASRRTFRIELPVYLIEFYCRSSPDIFKILRTCPTSPATFSYTGFYSSG